MEVFSDADIDTCRAHRAHLSRREPRRLECVDAFSRRTPAGPPEVAAALHARGVALIERLVGEDRTPVSSTLLLVAGIGAAQARRQAVLAAVEVANRQARVHGAIGARRYAQIARHFPRARTEVEVTAAGAGEESR
jgi:hypothetical protein